MNIFSEEFVSADIILKSVTYVMHNNAHSESLVLEYCSKNDDKLQKHYFLREKPILSAWMQFLDYGMPDDEKTPDVLPALIDAVSLLPTGKNITDYLSDITASKYSELTKKLLTALSSAIKKRSLLGYLYPMYYRILHEISRYLNNKISEEKCAEAISVPLDMLKEELDHFSSTYEEARAYCDSVLFATDPSIPDQKTRRIIEAYHTYCLDTDKPDFFYEGRDELSLQSAAINKLSLASWADYRSIFADSSDIDENTTSYPINSLKQFLAIGIDTSGSLGILFRKCRLCGGYFYARYFATQTYCSRIYNGTKASCYEYASKKSYKEKLFQNPINEEFTKAYNILYGRIRRGKLPADTPLMDDIKKLHDEYRIRYDDTHEKDRTELYREYQRKNREVLGK